MSKNYAPRFKSWLWIIGILLIGAGVRFYDIGGKSLWGDEFHTLTVAAGQIEPNSHRVRYSPLAVIQHMPQDVDVPFYFILLNLWIRLFGNSEAGLRTLSAVFSVAAIGVLYGSARVLLQENIGRISALLMALSPLHVSYAQEARPYALQIFLILASTYFFVRLVFSGARGPGVWAGYLITALLAVYTHYFAALIYLTHNLFLIATRRDLFFTRTWLASQMLLALMWLWPFLTLFFVPSYGWVQTASPYDAYWPYVTLPLALSKFTFADYAMEVLRVSRPALLLGIPLVGILFLFGAVALIRDHGRQKALFLFMWLSVPVLVLLGVDIVKNTRAAMVARYIMAASPAYYIILSSGICALKNRAGRLAALAAMALLLTLALAQYYRDTKLEQWREAAQYIEQNTPPAGLLVFYPGDMSFIHYYIPRARPERTIDIDGASELEDIDESVTAVLVLIRNTSHLMKESDLEQIGHILGRHYRLTDAPQWNGVKILKYERN